MPKVKKARSLPSSSSNNRHDPLGQVITDDVNRHKYAAPMRRKHRILDDDEEADTRNTLLDEKTSQRILQLSKQQQLEVEAEEVVAARRRQQQQQRQRQQPSGVVDSDDEEDDDADQESTTGDFRDDGLVQRDDGYVTIVEGTEGLSPEEEALVASMMQPEQTEQRRTLADIILEKIQEKEAEKAGQMRPDDDDGVTSSLPPKVVEVYTEIGKLLSRYTSGKLPKAFKVIPSLSNWEEVLYLTRPDFWTPQAMYQATRIFASNLNPKMAQRFYNLVLLDAVRMDIQHNKKLNYHLYMALKKCVYKPAAFFKGILLPLCHANCTLREAAIVASVLQRVSIAVHHSSVALHKLALETTYSGASSIFIKTLLNKKYSLPAPVIGSLVQHFANFQNSTQILPVLWHQALLVFVQRYKHEVQDQARELLKRVMKRHFHPKITPEIRRELFGAQAYRDERQSVGGTSGRVSVGGGDNDSMML